MNNDDILPQQSNTVTRTFDPLAPDSILCYLTEVVHELYSQKAIDKDALGYLSDALMNLENRLQAETIDQMMGIFGEIKVIHESDFPMSVLEKGTTGGTPLK